ncbi:MAG: cupredoxin domain-containing protein, partial [Vicinamibacterales bacterium]
VRAIHTNGNVVADACVKENQFTRIVRLGIALTALAIAAGCGSSSSTPTTPSTGTSAGSGTPITIVKGAQTLTTTAYSPNPLTIAAGTTVTWTNSDNTQHTAVSDTGTFNSGLINPNAGFSFTFPSKGTFTYHCSLHPNMVGSVVVQ